MIRLFLLRHRSILCYDYLKIKIISAFIYILTAGYEVASTVFRKLFLIHRCLALRLALFAPRFVLLLSRQALSTRVRA